MGLAGQGNLRVPRPSLGNTMYRLQLSHTHSIAVQWEVFDVSLKDALVAEELKIQSDDIPKQRPKGGGVRRACQ